MWICWRFFEWFWCLNSKKVQVQSFRYSPELLSGDLVDGEFMSEASYPTLAMAAFMFIAPFRRHCHSMSKVPRPISHGTWIYGSYTRISMRFFLRLLSAVFDRLDIVWYRDRSTCLGPPSALASLNLSGVSIVSVLCIRPWVSQLEWAMQLNSTPIWCLRWLTV